MIAIMREHWRSWALNAVVAVALGSYAAWVWHSDPRCAGFYAGIAVCQPVIGILNALVAESGRIHRGAIALVEEVINAFSRDES